MCGTIVESLIFHLATESFFLVKTLSQSKEIIYKLRDVLVEKMCKILLPPIPYHTCLALAWSFEALKKLKKS